MPKTAAAMAGGKVSAAGYTGNTTMTALTGGASVALGTGVQLVSSIPEDTVGIVLEYRNTAGGAPKEFITLAVSSDMTKVVLPDFYTGSAASSVIFSQFIPICLPAGQPLYAALRSSASASGTCVVGVQLISAGAGAKGYRRATVYGLTASTPTGTTLSGSATPNTYGSASDFTASTTNPIRALHVFALPLSSAPTANSDLWVDIIEGSSDVIIATLQLRYSGAQPVYATKGPLPITPLAAGTQLRGRVRASTSTADSRDANVYVLGYD